MKDDALQVCFWLLGHEALMDGEDYLREVQCEEFFSFVVLFLSG